MGYIKNLDYCEKDSDLGKDVPTAYSLYPFSDFQGVCGHLHRRLFLCPIVPVTDGKGTKWHRMNST